MSTNFDDFNFDGDQAESEQPEQTSKFDFSSFDFDEEEIESKEPEQTSKFDFSSFNFDEEEIDLDDIDYSEKAAYGAAQETTIGANIFRMAKAAVLAGTSDDSWTESLNKMEKERQRDIDLEFPEFRGLETSEEDLAILSGRLGVALVDPVTFVIPWAKAAKAASITGRVAKTAALGATVGAVENTARQFVTKGEVEATELGLSTAVGAGSSLLGLGVERGINFYRGRNAVIEAVEDSTTKVTSKADVDLNESEADSVINAVETVLKGSDDDLLTITASNSFMPEYRAASEAIRIEKEALTKASKQEGVTAETAKELKNKKASLTRKQTKLDKKLQQDTLSLIDKKNEINLKALEELAGTESFTEKAGRSILQQVTTPIVGATGGSFVGLGLREDEYDTTTVYTTMALGAGIGVAAKKIANSTSISSMNKQKAKMVLDEAGHKNINATVKLLSSNTTAERMEAMGGWNKAIGSLLLQKFGSNVDSIEARTLRKQSEWVGIINNRAGVSHKDNAVLDVVGESMFGFAPKNLVGYKGIRGDLKPLTKEQAAEVVRITPLFKEAQESIKIRAGKSGIEYNEIDFYGMSVRHDYSRTRGAKELAAHRADLMVAVKLHNKNLPEGAKKVSATAYVNSVLDMNTSKAGKYVPSGKGPSPFEYDKAGKVVKMRRAADFFEFERKLTDPEALKYLASKGRLSLNARDVLTSYGNSSLKVFEFTDVLGPNGEVINLALKDIKKAFPKISKVSLNQADPGKQYTKQLTGAIEAYWGGYSHGGVDFAKKSVAAFTTLANTTYLTAVSIANMVDLSNPFIKSGLGASAKALLQKVKGKSKSQMSHFKYDQSYERELDTLLTAKSPSQQGLTSRVTDFTNRNFFYFVGLKKVNQMARNFAYDVGVNRAYDLSQKYLKKKRFSRVDIEEIKDLGLNVDDIKQISKYSNVEEAFEEKNARSILDIGGRKAAERDAIVPNVSNRLLFTNSNTPMMKATGQFLSWSQGKSAEVNAVVSRIENGDAKLLVRTAAAIPVVVAFEQLRQWSTSNDNYYDREPTDDALDSSKELIEGVRRSGLAMNWKREWLTDFVKYNTSIMGGKSSENFNASDAIAPALAMLNELGSTAVKAGKNIGEEDYEGAVKEVVEKLPLGKPILKTIKAATGKPLLYDTPSEKEDDVVGFNKGGEVLDVPNVPTEPDQRIDKMTGRPYDQQAGTAFVDEEDPLRRLGFKGGGEVDPLRRLGFGRGGKVLNVLRNRSVQ